MLLETEIKLTHIVICIIASAAGIIFAKTALYMKFLGFQYFAYFVVSDDIAGAIMLVAIATNIIYLIRAIYSVFFGSDRNANMNNDSSDKMEKYL